MLKQVADVLKTVNDKQIRIEGHTDNVPIGGKLQQKFPTNWELSTARATNVVRYFIEKGGVNRENFEAVGYADTRPVADNETDERRHRESPYRDRALSERSQLDRRRYQSRLNLPCQRPPRLRRARPHIIPHVRGSCRTAGAEPPLRPWRATSLPDRTGQRFRWHVTEKYSILTRQFTFRCSR